MEKASEQPEDDLEAAVDAAIDACDGDLRATVRALVVANRFLHARVQRLQSLCSSGYAGASYRCWTCPKTSILWPNEAENGRPFRGTQPSANPHWVYYSRLRLSWVYLYDRTCPCSRIYHNVH
jgi:hypothetical protein